MLNHIRTPVIALGVAYILHTSGIGVTYLTLS